MKSLLGSILAITFLVLIIALQENVGMFAAMGPVVLLGSFFLLDKKFFYYAYFALLFISTPLISIFPVTIVFSDFLLLGLLLMKLGGIFDTSIALPPLKYDKKLVILLLLQALLALVSVLLNLMGGFSTLVVMAGFWSVYRLLHVTIVYIIFSDSNFKISLLRLFQIFLGMCVLQIPAWIARAGEYGTFFPHHASLGTFMLIPSIMSICVLLDPKSDLKMKIYSTVLFIFSFSWLMLSEGRSALLGFIFAVIVLVVVKTKLSLKRIVVAGAVLTLFLGIAMMTPLRSVVDRTFEKDSGNVDISTRSRPVIWMSAYKHWEKQGIARKLFGTGITMSREQMEIPFLHGGDRYIPSAHNNYLTVLAEVGVVGLAVFLSVYLYMLFVLVKKYRKTGSSLVLSMILLTIAMLGSSVAQESLWTHAFIVTSFIGYFVFYSLIYHDRIVE